MKKFKKYILITLASLLLCTSTAFTLSYEEAYLTATLFGEASGEGVTGMQTVASVIMNRRNYYQAHAKGGQTVKLSDVCLARYQFSFWNNKRNWTVQNIESWASKLNGANARAWNQCLNIARQAIAGSLKDVTNGATFYYATWMDKEGKAPAWARRRKFKVVGNHKIVYGVGLSALKTWHSGTSLAGGGGGSSWNGTLSGGSNIIDSGDYDLASDPANKYIMPPECKGAAEANGQIVNNEIMKHRLFAEDILIDLKDMMALIYQSLSVLFARGHALMCFSTKVSFICLDGGAGFSAALKSLVSCTVVVPLLNYFISGLLIYLTGFFMCMSIGMYFIDISFKLGFATLLLPLSISLWPFPPTQSKLSENIAIVIYNAMLFAFVSIGTAYAVKLVEASLGMVKDAEFWKIMGATDNGLGDGLANTTATWITLNSGNYADSMEKFSESYDLSSVNILIILFALIFGFKILSSSIQNYLSTFFGDGALGSADTAMHHMGTQAVGQIKKSVVNPAARVARDITLNQGGKGIEKLGNKLANKKFGGGAAAPVQGGTNPQTSPSGGAAPSPASNADDTAGNTDDNTGITPNTPINNDSESGGQPTADNSKTPQTTDSGSPQTADNGATGSENSNTGRTQSENAQSAEVPQTKWQQFKNYSRPTSHSLTIGNTFKAIRHPQQTYRTLKQLARQGSQDWKNAETLKDKGSLVLKKSGQVVIRSIRGNANEAANAGMGIAGGFLQSLGKSMQKKPQHYYRERQKQKNNRSYDDREYQRQQEEEYLEEQERINNSN